MRPLLDRIEAFGNLHPNSIALSEPQRTVTYGALPQTIHDVSRELNALGIKRLAIYGDNTIDWALIDLAASTSNITVVPIPLFFRTHKSSIFVRPVTWTRFSLTDRSPSQ